MTAIKVYLSAIVGMLFFGWFINVVAQLLFGRGTSPSIEFYIMWIYGAAGAIVGALAATAQSIYAATKKSTTPPADQH